MTQVSHALLPEMTLGSSFRRARQYTELCASFNLRPEVVLYIGGDADYSPSSVFQRTSTAVHYATPDAATVRALRAHGQDAAEHPIEFSDVRADLILFGRQALGLAGLELLVPQGLVFTDNQPVLLEELGQMLDLRLVARAHYTPTDPHHDVLVRPVVPQTPRPFHQLPLQPAASNGLPQPQLTEPTSHELAPTSVNYDPAHDILAFQRSAAG